MYQKGIPVTGTTAKATATTYTIDVYHAQQNASQTSLLTSIAKNSGGRYFSATDANAIKVALQNIFAEIQATNSTFASAALPISATNRTQNDNQVYIGMFRPDQQSFPRWFGNLKRYQFGVVNGSTTLVDAQSPTPQPAVSTTSGFIDNCAQSYWTTDSGNYWADINSGIVSPRIFITTASSAGTAWTTQGDDTNLAKGQCTTNTSGSTYSDLPDGPIVEKGGAAELLRKSTTSRTIKTLSGVTGTTVQDFNTTNVTTLSSNSTVNNNIVNFIRGQDITGEIEGSPSSSNRPSIHGDVIHSKPLAVDFGSTNGVNVYYGANDGTYRSVNASTGAENWAFVAPEFFASTTYSASQTYSPLQRLLDNSPVVQTPSPTPTNNTAAPGSPKDFFFDGSTGLYQNSDSSKVWIYPSMRRGGRMIYAFDESIGVTSKPKVLWKAGCNSSGCTDTQLSNIGQTWSTPNVAFLSGYSTTTPIVVVGGGYDTCEDADTNPATTSGFCSSPKGAAVYVLDGSTGTVVKTFTTDRSVAADVTLVDVNLDGQVDLAYVADTGGNIYRINFTDPSNNFSALSSSNWTIKKVAYTSGAGRKFLFAPAVLPYQGKVYVAIGSGDREHPTSRSYPYTTPITNRFYVYLDDPAASSSTAAVNMDGSTFFNYTTSSTDTCNSTKVLPNGTNPGWYMDLTENGIGEQVVTSALITSGLVAFSTNRPIAGEVCSNDLGEARGYLVNLLNGSGAITSSGNAICGGVRSSTFVGGGLPPSPVSGVVVINGVAQQVVIGVAQRDSSVSTAISAQKFNPPIKATRSRLYWRTPTDTH
jgi:Tfp pilus tip-associated adhesin PilY1